LTGMASLLFRLCGRSPHNSPLVIGPRALATTLNQRGGRGRPPNPEEMLQTIGQMMAQVARRSDASTPFARCWSMYACYGCGLLRRPAGAQHGGLQSGDAGGFAEHQLDDLISAHARTHMIIAPDLPDMAPFRDRNRPSLLRFMMLSACML